MQQNRLRAAGTTSDNKWDVVRIAKQSEHELIVQIFRFGLVKVSTALNDLELPALPCSLWEDCYHGSIGVHSKPCNQ